MSHGGFSRVVHFLQRIGELIAFFANAKSCIVERRDSLSCFAVASEAADD
jgi:hypothetical protein